MLFKDKVEAVKDNYIASLNAVLFSVLEELSEDMKKTGINYVGLDFEEGSSGIFPGILFFSKFKKDRISDYGLETDGYSGVVHGDLTDAIKKEFGFSNKDVAFITKATGFFKENVGTIISNFDMDKMDSIDVYQDKISVCLGNVVKEKVDIGFGFVFLVPELESVKKVIIKNTM